MVELEGLMSLLAKQYLIFHSEADFQHALAWHLHELYSEARVRLEYRPFREEAIYLDISLQGKDELLAIELKYATRKIEVQLGDEYYSLKNHAAQDLKRYDFIKDIARLERVIEAFPRAVGYAIFLTNDSSYWKPSRQSNAVDTAFRIHEGAVIGGTLEWAAHTGSGTTATREKGHTLRSTYTMTWQDYSSLPVRDAYNRFRYVIVRVS